MTPTSREDRAHKNAENTRPDRASSKVDKARALLLRDGIVERPSRTFLARTLGTDHHVTLYTDDGTTSCTCLAGRHGVECYAVFAAKILAADLGPS